MHASLQGAVRYTSLLQHNPAALQAMQQCLRLAPGKATTCPGIPSPLTASSAVTSCPQLRGTGRNFCRQKSHLFHCSCRENIGLVFFFWCKQSLPCCHAAEAPVLAAPHCRPQLACSMPKEGKGSSPASPEGSCQQNKQRGSCCVNSLSFNTG